MVKQGYFSYQQVDHIYFLAYQFTVLQDCFSVNPDYTTCLEVWPVVNTGKYWEKQESWRLDISEMPKVKVPAITAAYGNLASGNEEESQKNPLTIQLSTHHE